MANEDTNAIIHAYLIAQTTLTDIVSDRIMVPRLAENTGYPAVGFFTRGGTSTPYIPGLVTPSVQFDCWAEDVDGGLSGPRGARLVYNRLYDVLQGIARQVVTVDGTEYIIWSAWEEVQGQDLADGSGVPADIIVHYRVLTFFSFIIKAV